ncbi:DUF1214 domain-containing protein [Cupriavidus necator]|uniref:DUF1214 domain-containing protein n=1 Tax=Cupriavidus necator TaxID=106590 RepID=UPI003AF34017
MSPHSAPTTTPRTAAAKANILVNSPNETKYYYLDLDASGARLNSANRYTITFPKDATPPVNGFWSLSIYNSNHFFVANPINRFSVGTKNKDLQPNNDGSLTIYVQATPPGNPLQHANWLPAPKGDFSLYVRAGLRRQCSTVHGRRLRSGARERKGAFAGLIQEPVWLLP